MSVLIKGMMMPKNCWNCPFFHTSMYHIGDDELLERYTCLRTGERTDKNVTGYMKNCPLIELPPHGRLIDADAPIGQYKGDIWTAMIDYAEGVRDVVEDIKHAPTIVPAEGKED